MGAYWQNRVVAASEVNGENQPVLSNRGRFPKGHVPWNRGKTGYMGANATSFKKGDLPPQTLPEGTVSNHYKKGKLDAVVINIDWQGNRKSKYSYARYVWEVAHQQDLPANHVIYHIDGNKLNNEIGNLVAITRAELVRLNR